MKQDAARDLLVQCLERRGLKMTRQREEILQVFLGARSHLTVDELFGLVRKRMPAVGIATVHRNVRLFTECGLADEIKVGNQKTRYEPAVGTEHHDHLICRKCGAFEEVLDERIEKLQEELARKHDFIPERHRLEIYGLCRNCR